MRILGFDTCLDKMYVTLSENGKILSSSCVETTESNYHSAFLISTIRNILKNNNIKSQDVDVIATDIGPGSFTGIRSCTTVTRVFAQAANLKTVGVSSLEIISRINKTKQKTLVALDARKGMAYIAIFEQGKTIFEPKTILLDELKELLNRNEYFLITDDRLQPILGGISYQQQNDDLGEFLVRIAFEKINFGCETNWEKLLPLYIQQPALHIKNS